MHGMADALLAEKHQQADFVFRAESNRNNRNVAEHDRLVRCDVVRPVLFVVVLNLREIVDVARQPVSRWNANTSLPSHG
ncbi:hypothetical protein P3T25_003976 [Paraburkholderia sp. GAS32]